MIIILFISLYSSRLILKALGAVDYGLFNVVGGLIAMMSFLTSAMASGFQRYQNVCLGLKDREKYKHVIAVSFSIQIMMATICIIIAETIGYWFFKTQMVIPSERFFAASIIFHTTLMIFVLGLFMAPLSAVIISHERMKIYAYISIFNSVSKLIIAIMLSFIHIDKLISYAILLLLLELFTIIIYYIMVRKIDNEISIKPKFDKVLFKDMLGFSTWNLFGTLAFVLKGNGINIVLNIFFGPIVNAARGIAYQVSGGIDSLYQNFQLAVRPQIMKNYACGNIDEMNNLVYMVSRISFMLLWIVSLPVLFSTDFVLSLWLGNYPEYTLIFTRLVILTSLFGCVANPISTIVHATGKMKKYQIICGCTILLIVPLSYIVLKLGAPPPAALYVSLSITILVHIIRLYLVNEIVPFPFITYFKKVVWPCLFVSVISLFISAIISTYIEMGGLLIVTLLLVSTSSVFILGLSIREREFIINKILNIIRR